MNDIIAEIEQKEFELAHQEFETRKLIWHFTFPRWVQFENLHGFVTMYPRYWWMTRSQMEWFYTTYFKGHKDEKYFSKPYVKYSDAAEVENCKSGVDRNIKRYTPNKEQVKRRAEYRYLTSKFN